MTLVEILVAVSVSTVVLGAAWSWLWAAGGEARRVDGRAQAATAAAFAARSLATDLEMSIALLRPPAGRLPTESLCVLHRHPDGTVETVLVVWDPVRQVLWRKTSSTYLADHVESFSIEYFRADEQVLGPTDFEDPEWPESVSRLRVSICVSGPGGTGRAVRDVALRR